MNREHLLLFRAEQLLLLFDYFSFFSLLSFLPRLFCIAIAQLGILHFLSLFFVLIIEKNKKQTKPKQSIYELENAFPKSLCEHTACLPRMQRQNLLQLWTKFWSVWTESKSDAASQIWLRPLWISSEIRNCATRRSVNSPVELQWAISSSQSLKLKPLSTCLHVCSRVETAKLITCPVNNLDHEQWEKKH